MILFRLAGHLGMTVGELERRMSAREFAEWLAYWRVEPPWDPWRAFGVAMATIVGLWSKSKPKPEDFMPRARPKPKRQTVRQMQAAMDFVRARGRT